MSGLWRIRCTHCIVMNEGDCLNCEMLSLRRGKIERGYGWMMTVEEKSMKQKSMMTTAFQRGKR